MRHKNLSNIVKKKKAIRTRYQKFELVNGDNNSKRQPPLDELPQSEGKPFWKKGTPRKPRKTGVGKD